jgi:hypothetical protein
MKILAVAILLGIHTRISVAFAYRNSPRIPPKRIEPSLFSVRTVGNRRDWFSSIVGVSIGLIGTTPTGSYAVADDENDDLTSRLFNPDGSLRDKNTETQAKFTTTAFSWDAESATQHLNVDGTNIRTAAGSSVRLKYELPEKYTTTAASKNLDRGATEYEHITIYQPPGNVAAERLEQASALGIANALQLTDELQVLNGADLIGGRTNSKKGNGQKYFEFDLAVAPPTCEASKEDLGLGFCPYNSIFLVSASIYDDRLYVFALECNKDQWKRSNTELKRIRSSFLVTGSS